MKYLQSFKKQSGMTLLEILLYVAISALVLFAASSLLSTIYEVRQKGHTIQTAEEEGALLSYTIDRYVKNAVRIGVPELFKTEGRLDATVVLNEKEVLISVFAEEGVMYAIIDNGPKTALSSSDIMVQDLAFSQTGSLDHGFVSYSFTVKSTDKTGRNEYQKTFTGGAALR